MNFKILGKLSILVASLAILSGSIIASENEEDSALIEQKALDALEGLSDYLHDADTLSFNAVVSTQDVSSQLQKLQFSNDVKGALQRPNKLYMEKTGSENVTLWFDGLELTVLDRDKNVYIELSAPGSISDAIETLNKLGAETPFAGLMQESLRDHAEKHVFKGDHYGTASLGELECHHLALRQDSIDWQLWTVKDTNAPRKIVVTSKMLTGMPEHEVLFLQIERNTKLDAKIFDAVLPTDAEEIQLAGEDAADQVTDSALMGAW